MPQPSIPASLTPGRQRTQLAWDISVLNSGLHSPSAPSTSPHFPGRMSLYGDFYFSQPPPPLPPPPPPPLPQRPPALVNPRPPIPPKPSALIAPSPHRNPLYPQSIPVSMVPGPSTMFPGDSMSRSPSEDKEIALAFSAAVVSHEEELAQALEEARLMTHSFDDNAAISQLSQPSPSTSAKLTAPPSPADGVSWLHLSTPTTPQLGPASMIGEPPPWTQAEDSKSLSNNNGRPTNETFQSTSADTRDSQFAPADSMPVPSLYSNVVSSLVTKPISSIPSSPSPSTMHTPHPPTSPTFSLAHSPGEPLVSPEPLSPSSPPPFISSGHSSSISLATKSSYTLNTALESSVSLAKSANGDKFFSATNKSPKSPASPDTSLEASHLNLHDEEEDADPPTRPILTFSANQYVDVELLLGVCKYGSPVDVHHLTWIVKRWDLIVQ